MGWISCCDLVGKLCLRRSGLHIYGLCVPSSELFQQVQKRPNLSLGGPAWSYELDAAIITHPFQLWRFYDSWRSITQEKLTTWWSHHQTTTSERHVKSQGRARSKNEPREVHLENVMAVNLARGFASAWKEIPCRTAKAFPDTSLGQIQKYLPEENPDVAISPKNAHIASLSLQASITFFFPHLIQLESCSKTISNWEDTLFTGASLPFAILTTNQQPTGSVLHSFQCYSRRRLKFNALAKSNLNYPG